MPHDVLQRELPNSSESERNLIALALLDGRIPPAARVLAPSDFYNPRHRLAWAAFLTLDREATEINPFNAEPHTQPELTANDLTQFTVGMSHGVNDIDFIRRIRDCSARRHAMLELSRQSSRLADQEEPTADILRSLRAKLEDYDVSSVSRGRFRSLAEIIDAEVMEALEALHQSEGNISTAKIPTGFSAIDREIGGGVSLSDVLLFAGLPGSGKSAGVLQISANMAAAGHPVAFLSGEMSDRENVFRLLSQMSGMTNLNAVMHITREELDGLREWAHHVKKLPLFFDAKTFDLNSITHSMRSLVEQDGVKVLVIDYIQLLRPRYGESRISRYERITESSQEIKRLAMELEVAVIEVAQFNRTGAKSDRPSMHDLEGSSQLEKDASLIFILDREQQSLSVTLRIVKGRNAGVCELRGSFDGRVLTFSF